MAVINLIFSPFLLVFLMLFAFFKSAEEYQKKASSIGSRQYTLFAQWKFREFNEYPHVLSARLTRSHEAATKYVEQFPMHLLAIAAKSVSFISGSLAAILLIMTLFSEDLQQGFEITPGRSALFYIGVFGSIMALGANLVPAETFVFDPERWMRDVALETHFLPHEWKDKAHTDQVRKEFNFLFPNKLKTVLQEAASVIFAPLILYKSLPESSLAIVDFFREFTIHVDSCGYVCSFALFDFKRHGNPEYGAPDGPKDNMISNMGKMEHSFMNFRAHNPKWEPGNEGSDFLKALNRTNLRSELSGSIADSFLKEKETYLPGAAGREFFAILEAVYEAKNRTIN